MRLNGDNTIKYLLKDDSEQNTPSIFIHNYERSSRYCYVVKKAPIGFELKVSLFALPNLRFYLSEFYFIL